MAAARDVARAVTAAAGGVAVLVDVVPGAAEDAFPAGWNPWRGRVEARVAAPPERGEANAALARVVAAFLGVPARAVSVTSGHTSRRKTLTVEDADADLVITRITEGLA